MRLEFNRRRRSLLLAVTELTKKQLCLDDSLVTNMTAIDREEMLLGLSGLQRRAVAMGLDTFGDMREFPSHAKGEEI